MPKAIYIFVRTIQDWPFIAVSFVGDTDKKRSSPRRRALTLVLFIIGEAYGSSRAGHTKWPTKAAREKGFDKGNHTEHTTETAHSVLLSE